LLEVGDTFLLPSSVDGKAHLWIVLTPPEPNGRAVCVNITSHRPAFCETTVILAPGEHPFIKKESVVQYKDADFLNIRALSDAFSAGLEITCYPRERCSGAMLKKAQEGLLVSKQTKNAVKQYCRAIWGA
jgi:hypothetical protein